MRLVCDKCSAVHTIEDRLVGARDFRVSCKECGAPIVVRSAQQVPSERPPADALGLPPLKAGGSVRPSAPARRAAAAAPQGFAPAGGETWFVSLGGAQQGPYTAAEFSRLLEQERLDWTTPVWREGLKDWRPARRDAILVTSVAGARGHAGDTMRLNSSRSFLAPEDTVVDLRPQALHPSSPQPLGVAPVLEDLLSSNSETQTIDARNMVIPKLTPSARPAAWSSPENASFRAGLGMPADSMQIPKPASVEQPAVAPTLAEAFRSAPALLRAAPRMESTAELDLSTHMGGSSPAGEGFMPKPQSMLAVAAMAFAAGVVVAAASSYFGKKSEPAPVDQVVAAAPKQAPVVRPAPAPLPSTESLRELPDPEELRAEVRHVAPDVKRCVDDPALGVDVDIYLDGPSGRVRDVDVRSPALPPGRIDCVSHAVRQMQLVPFTRPELKLMHKFSW